ncbi:hypothetical protein P7K49_022781 [Saguinus oedipus]|uniref:Uncharacterized protein n=1 Tax=Saguinus oedipus TaxID=9490 RepID=A0ABQ9UKM2_SAGOE|nr:hypothetical protein P7K49_022781 [Saguinus oedipus]
MSRRGKTPKGSGARWAFKPRARPPGLPAPNATPAPGRRVFPLSGSAVRLSGQAEGAPGKDRRTSPGTHRRRFPSRRSRSCSQSPPENAPVPRLERADPSRRRRPRPAARPSFQTRPALPLACPWGGRRRPRPRPASDTPYSPPSMPTRFAPGAHHWPRQDANSNIGR